MEKSKKENMIGIRIDDKTYQDLTNLAERNRRSLSQMVRIVIEDYIQIIKNNSNNYNY